MSLRCTNACGIFTLKVVSNTHCVVFLFCFSSSCVPYVTRFSVLSIFDCPSVFSNVYLCIIKGITFRKTRNSWLCQNTWNSIHSPWRNFSPLPWINPEIKIDHKTMFDHRLVRMGLYFITDDDSLLT